jgi:hypothetical protein
MCTEKHLVDVCDSKYSLTGAATPEQQCPRRKGGGTKDFTCGAQLLSFLGKLYKSSPTSTYKTNSDVMSCTTTFECVPEVTIDRRSMIDWIKEVNNEKYWMLLV